MLSMDRPEIPDAGGDDWGSRLVALLVAVCLGVAALIAVVVGAPAAQAETWRYAEDALPMGGTSRAAAVVSADTVTFGFPYRGQQSGALVMRNDPRWGIDVRFDIDAGHILCNSYRNPTIAIRFDDEPATTVRCIEPDDHTITTVFLDRARWIIEKARKAKKVTLGITFYQEGVRYFSFDVRGLDPSKIGVAPAAEKKAPTKPRVARHAAPAASPARTESPVRTPDQEAASAARRKYIQELRQSIADVKRSYAAHRGRE